MPVPKVEGSCKKWWITSLFSESGEELTLNGDFNGLEDIGIHSGEFNVLHVIRVDMVNKVAETEHAFIKLLEPANIDNMLKAMQQSAELAAKTTRNVVEKVGASPKGGAVRAGPISKPRKGGDD